MTAASFSKDVHAERALLIHVVNAIPSSKLVSLTHADLLIALEQTVNSARYWQPPDEVDEALRAPALDDTLERIARAVMDSPHATWWMSATELLTQRAVQWYHGTLGGWDARFGDRGTSIWPSWRRQMIAEEHRALRDRPADPAAAVTGRWWSSPANSGCASTTRMVAELPAVELDLREDSLGSTRARVRQAQPRPHTRIYEIHSPADWTRLVEQYPLDVSASKRHDWFSTTGRAGHWHMPDWSAVGEDYDAAHLSVIGYLTTSGMALPVRVRHIESASVLAGWSPDETYWLNPDAVHIIDDATEYDRDDERWHPE